jgi:predicted kinase
MPKLIMCQGLPGSGKTTWAKEQQASSNCLNTVRVNKDDIRRELESEGWSWSREGENRVLLIRDTRIVRSLHSGAQVVISDDTNFGRKHKINLEQLARENGAEFEIKRFDTPVEECIRRDAQREGKARVGEEVIRKMAAQYVELQPASFLPAVYQPELMPAVICDLDGTLSLFKEKGHRGPYDASKCNEDDLNVPVYKCLRAMNGYFVQIIYLSGRFDTYRPQTLEFLSKHSCPLGPLYMRAGGDTRKDAIVKCELFDKHVRGKYNVLFVLDDRDQVVKMWRSIGLTCFQVAEGNF